MPSKRRKSFGQNETCKLKRTSAIYCQQSSIKSNTGFVPLGQVKSSTNANVPCNTDESNEMKNEILTRELSFEDRNLLSIECSCDSFQNFAKCSDRCIEKEPKTLKQCSQKAMKRNRSNQSIHPMRVRSQRLRGEKPVVISTATASNVLSQTQSTSSSGLILFQDQETSVDTRDHNEFSRDHGNLDNIPSTYSFEDMCRICHSGESVNAEFGQPLSACSCRGTVGRVHVKCLERWLTESGKSRCELCGTRYATRRVHKYGVARALLMWMMSHNAKQLIVDSLGIMLMSPLAVLAAWLSGRTLAGLMSQEMHVTPWPLASTFVLACMTLVCYYCWIVSAATRHALRWWLWYRAQYEVRLEIQEDVPDEA